MSTNDGTAPVYENSDDLPADFVIEDVCPLNEEQTRHRVAFYQSALTKFSKQANNGGMLFREQFTRIRDAMIRLHNGKKASSLKAEYSQIHPWSKKFGVMVVADSLVLICRNRKVGKITMWKKKMRLIKIVSFNLHIWNHFMAICLGSMQATT